MEGLAPEGTLEAWTFNYLVRVDVAPEQIMLVGGMYEEDGWYDLEGQGGHNIVALRYPDGSYNLVYNAVANDNMSFYSYHNSYEEAIYDWYVTENNLNLPLHVKNLTAGGETIPVHRYDGDGWYVYIPVSGWNWTPNPTYVQTPQHWAWNSAYETGSAMIVDRFAQPVEVEYAVSRNHGFTPADSTNQVWEHNQDGIHETYYLYPTSDGGSLRVWTRWTDAGITDHPYIAMEPEVLRLMAESFTVDAQIKGQSSYDDVQLATVYDNGEIVITVPAKYADLIRLDDLGSDNLFSVKANLYYAPEYDENDADTPRLNGGWMLTVSTTFPDSAASVVGQPSEELHCGCWTMDGKSVYMENRPLEGFYNCGESNLEEFREVLNSIRVDYGALTPFEDASAVDTTSTSAIPLTKEELAWFNDWLEPTVKDKQGNDIGVNPRCCFLTSYYDDVTELNFEEFMRYFPGDGSQTSDAEFEALREVDDWPFAHVNSLDEMPVPVHKYPKRLVDLILGEYAGISTENLDTSGVAYLPEYDAYYNYTSDAGFGMFTCTRGEKNGDTVRLYDDSYGVKLLTLRQVSDTAYQVVSYQLLESTPG